MLRRKDSVLQWHQTMGGGWQGSRALLAGSIKPSQASKPQGAGGLGISLDVAQPQAGDLRCGAAVLAGAEHSLGRKRSCLFAILKLQVCRSDPVSPAPQEHGGLGGVAALGKNRAGP